MRGEFYNLDSAADGLVRELAPGLTTRIFAGEHATISIVTVAPNAAGALHAHPQEQWGFIIRGDGVRIQDGVEIAVSAGAFWRTPGGVPHGFRAGPSGALLIDVFSPPRTEYQRGEDVALSSH